MNLAEGLITSCPCLSFLEGLFQKFFERLRSSGRPKSLPGLSNYGSSCSCKSCQQHSTADLVHMEVKNAGNAFR